MLTPGLAFLIKQIPRLLIPPATVLIARGVLERALGFNLPQWVQLGLLLGSLPVAFFASVLLTDISNRIACYRLGAVMPPTVPSRLAGGLDLIPTLQNDLETDHLGAFMLERCNELGWTYNLRVAFEDKFCTAEPEHLKAILATDFDSYGKGPSFKAQAYSVLGRGMFNSDGEMWKFHRTMARPFFSRERIKDFELYQRHVDKAIHHLKERLSQGYAVDFQDAMGRFTLDTASEFLFNHCVNSLDAGIPYSPNVEAHKDVKVEENSFAKAFAAIQDAITIRWRYSAAWPLFEIFKDRTKEDMRVVGEVIDPVIRVAIEKKRAMANEGKDEEADTFIDHLVKYTEDPVLLKDEVLNIMIAGRDTTASTLTFLAYILAMHPNVLVRLRAEILAQVGPNRLPTLEDFREMKYMRAVINETLRLFPPVPFNLRETERATTWVNKTDYGGGKPFYLPANTCIPYCVMFMHRREDLWGPDALEFDPDRFLDERLQKYLIPNPFIFLPFNAGPRICLGQQFAYNEISYMLVRLLQTFNHIDLAPDSQPPKSVPPASWASCTKAQGRKGVEKVWPRSHLTMYVVGGLWLRLHLAEGS